MRAGFLFVLSLVFQSNFPYELSEHESNVYEYAEVVRV
jgi:hypothetical protein